MIQCDVDEIAFVFLPEYNEMMSNYEAFASSICLKIDELLELEKYTVNFKLNDLQATIILSILMNLKFYYVLTQTVQGWEFFSNSRVKV